MGAAQEPLHPFTFSCGRRGSDDADLLAAIGRIVVQAALLDYSVATLVATCEGLCGGACETRAVAIVRTADKALLV
jgi:hypothetical protein